MILATRATRILRALRPQPRVGTHQSLRDRPDSTSFRFLVRFVRSRSKPAGLWLWRLRPSLGREGKMTRDGSRASNVFRSRRRRSRHARACTASRDTIFYRLELSGSCHQHGSATVRDRRLATVILTSRVARGGPKYVATCPCPIYTKCTHTKNGSPPHEEPVLTTHPPLFTFLRDFHLLPPWPRGRKKKASMIALARSDRPGRNDVVT